MVAEAVQDRTQRWQWILLAVAAAQLLGVPPLQAWERARNWAQPLNPQPKSHSVSAILKRKPPSQLHPFPPSQSHSLSFSSIYSSSLLGNKWEKNSGRERQRGPNPNLQQSPRALESCLILFRSLLPLPLIPLLKRRRGIQLIWTCEPQHPLHNIQNTSPGKQRTFPDEG